MYLYQRIPLDYLCSIYLISSVEIILLFTIELLSQTNIFFNFFIRTASASSRLTTLGPPTPASWTSPTKTRTNSRRLWPPLDPSLSPLTQVIGHSSCTRRESTTSPPAALPDLTTVYSLLDTDQTAARIIGWLKIGMMSSDFSFCFPFFFFIGWGGWGLIFFFFFFCLYVFYTKEKKNFFFFFF